MRAQRGQRQWRVAARHSHHDRKGVRFVGEVSEDGEPPARVDVAPVAPEPRIAARLSIAVLPFANLSNDPEQQYFADGIPSDIRGSWGF